MSTGIPRHTVTLSPLAGTADPDTAGLASASARTHPGDTPAPERQQPTIVLLHGAFADASSWNGVTQRLQQHGYRTLAPALPLRGVATDAAYIGSVLNSIPGPIVLVGHSYGGAVISNAAAAAQNVQALVYIAAFVPDTGESALDLTAKFPGSTLGEAITTQSYPLPGGGQADELLIQSHLFRDQFASGVPVRTAQVMAATQRPIALAALQEPATVTAWKTLPSWFLVATKDRNIPPAAQHWMAERANAHTISVDAPHAVAVTDPEAVTHLILNAARRKH